MNLRTQVTRQLPNPLPQHNKYTERLQAAEMKPFECSPARIWPGIGLNDGQPWPGKKDYRIQPKFRTSYVSVSFLGGSDPGNGVSIKSLLG